MLTDRINLNKKLRYWNEALKCTAAELPNAVSAVDMMADRRADQG